MNIFLDRIEKSGGNVSVLVLQKIWEKHQKGEGLQYIVKNFNPKLIPGLVRQNTFTFESITIITFFLPGFKVMQAITKLLNYTFSALNNNESVLLVMLDISKSHDCIDYKILLKKLVSL